MRIPEKPARLIDLDLMKRLEGYSNGTESWRGEDTLGPAERSACRELHANLIAFVETSLHPLMDRVTAREMQGFTMHDRSHGMKVAHLMWHLLSPNRQSRLSPAEIALLVLAANFHDLGMGLSEQERSARLLPNSDLWDRLDPDSGYSKALEGLQALSQLDGTPQNMIAEAVYQIQQAQEALLCEDCRDRHATRERYDELLQTLNAFHREDPVRIPDPLRAISFDGDSLVEKLLEVCISHNEDAHVLLSRSPRNIDQWRFPTEYPVGCCTADVRLIAAALRLSDVLDFDRERTPPILFHYLLPRSADPSENVSVREWEKHLSISNWTIEDGRVVFRGRSPSPFIHHTIVSFCGVISEEIAKTQSIFQIDEWPFVISADVQTEIEAIGYRYVPYRFSLDEERIYDLLMGRSIYRSANDALRELLQNAVDACKLRDALMLSFDSSVVPSSENRIRIRYEEPTTPSGLPSVSVIDTGVGMDRYTIENFLLKVGRSYYKSTEFLRTRANLSKRGLDFKPVSEFGIGFMSVFMLGDRVEVETAPWASSSQDTRKRRLRIDGVGRLIEVYEEENSGASRYYGTRVTVQLASRSASTRNWQDITSYIRGVCRNLSFPLYLEYVTGSGTEHSTIYPDGLVVPVPEHLLDAAMRIAVDDQRVGLKGEIVIYREDEAASAEAALAAHAPVEAQPDAPDESSWAGTLTRGGFSVGRVPGLPRFVLTPKADARIEATRDKSLPRSLPRTDLARSHLIEQKEVGAVVFRAWLDTLLSNIKETEAKPIGSPDIDDDLLREADWLESYNAYDLYRLACTCWPSSFKNPKSFREKLGQWENGEVSILWIGNTYSQRLHKKIFDLILPSVSQMKVGRWYEQYVSSPKSGWRDNLVNWRSFISRPVSWPIFAEYIGDISDALYVPVGRLQYFNSRYQNVLEVFSENELKKLFEVIEKLAEAKNFSRRAILSLNDMTLAEKLLEIAPDAPILRFEAKYKIRDLMRKRS